MPTSRAAKEWQRNGQLRGPAGIKSKSSVRKRRLQIAARKLGTALRKYRLEQKGES
jgi:hypothetical protein